MKEKFICGNSEQNVWFEYLNLNTLFKRHDSKRLRASKAYDYSNERLRNVEHGVHGV